MGTTHRTRTLSAGAVAAAAAISLLAAPAQAVGPPEAPTKGGDVGVCAAGGGGDSGGGDGAPAAVDPVGSANEEYTQAFRDFGNSGGGWANEGGWAASDGVFSAELPGGELVWLMNDTFLGPVNDDESMTDPGFIHGSIVLGGEDGLPDTTITGGTQEEPESIASPPDAVDGDPWYWNGDGIMDGGKLRVFQGRTGQTDGEPPWNFAWLGNDIVTYTEDFEVESVTTTYGSADGSGIIWGNELMQCGELTYIYGTRSGEAFVARADAGHLVDRDWEFYTGTGWSSDELASAPITDDVGASYSVTPMGEQFVLTTSAEAIFTDHTIYVATAPTPVGPFTGRVGVYTAPEGGVGDLYAPYNVAAHPEISADGDLVVSYNVNSGVGADLLEDANNNRPRFVTIEF